MNREALPVRIAYAALGSGSWPVWIADAAGIFADEGLEAEVALVRGSGRLTQAILAGEVQFGNFAAPLAVEANRHGGDLVFVTGGLNWVIQSIVARPEITAPSQLRGRRFGGAAHGGGVDDYLVPALLAPHGLGVADLEMAPVDSQPDAIEKMLAGTIDAALFSPPYVFEAAKRGLRVLIDSTPLRIDYQLGGIVASRAFVTEHEELTRRVVRGYVRGVHRFRTDRAFALRVLKQYSLIEDDDVAEQTYACLMHYFQPVPLPSRAGLQAVLAQGDGQVILRAEELMDSRWLAELEDTGYIRALYG